MKGTVFFGDFYSKKGVKTAQASRICFFFDPALNPISRAKTLPGGLARGLLRPFEAKNPSNEPSDLVWAL